MKKRYYILLICICLVNYCKGQSFREDCVDSDTTFKDRHPPNNSISLMNTLLNNYRMRNDFYKFLYKSPEYSHPDVFIPKYDPHPPLFSIRKGNMERIKVYLHIQANDNYRTPQNYLTWKPQ